MGTVELIREETVRKSSGRSEAESLRKAIELARTGETAAARVLLVAVCRQNKECELGWFWLASVARNPSERLACIKQVLRINPASTPAREWLTKLRDITAEQPANAAPAQAAAHETTPAEPVAAPAPAPSPVDVTTDVARLSHAVQNEIDSPAEVAVDTKSIEAPEPEPESRMDSAPSPLSEEREVPAEEVPPAEQPVAETAVAAVAAASGISSFPALFESVCLPAAPAVEEIVAVEPPPVAEVTETVVPAVDETEVPSADAPAAVSVPDEPQEPEPVPVAESAVAHDAVEQVEVESPTEFEPETGIEPPPEIEVVVETALAPLTQYVAAPSASSLTDHTFPHVDQAVPAEPPPHEATAAAELSIAPEHRYAHVFHPQAIEPPPQVAVSADSASYLPPAVLAGAIMPHKPQLDTLAQIPTVEPTAEAPAEIATPEPEPAVDRCPICEAALAKPEHCDACKSVIWPARPLDFVLNRTVDHEVLQNLIERLQGVTCTAENELRTALAYCNLHQFDRARHHLERAAMLDFEKSAVALERVASFLQRPTVLVVDDSATIRDVLVRLLGKESFLPIPIGNAWEVVTAAKSQRPAVILLDVTMPLVDGYEVCRQIRADRETKSIPVVMVSGHVDLIDKVVAKLAGASDYLNKPFSPDQLLNTVRFYASKKR